MIKAMALRPDFENRRINKLRNLMKKILIPLFPCLGMALIFELCYFMSVYQGRPPAKPLYDCVLVYGGYVNRTRMGLMLADTRHIPIFLSEAYGGPEQVQKLFGKISSPIVVDHYARTTDQNARNAVKFMEEGGFHHAALVTNWYHQPRALLLTRMYLLGKEVEVQPYFFEKVPVFWEKEPDFWFEMVKIWGSLARVMLHWVHYDKPVFHQ